MCGRVSMSLSFPNKISKKKKIRYQIEFWSANSKFSVVKQGCIVLHFCDILRYLNQILIFFAELFFSEKV